ncbi:uncharacterized protein LOC111043748 isoform X2 [Nilaparvata lugens]|uniref:uncharacterized protein LOC111043748 isoform X1 n=1 Tax=Nilaparvata lugens TaxID=108931 RepID=UPI000B9929F9|nr:uncharacterized protein LOC111043748 isoform X1 [Nilaparvata lugens]XP_039278312.1 uncharacterized protein LOC111043748 isoform X2 [Nilaparvata lugens]
MSLFLKEILINKVKSSNGLLILSRSMQTVKPHVPMIQFRKGGFASGGGRNSGQSSSSPAPTANSSKPGQVHARPTIEDYQLPHRYRRQQMDEKEIEAVNSGVCLF